jgi:hypothetical protein
VVEMKRHCWMVVGLGREVRVQRRLNGEAIVGGVSNGPVSGIDMDGVRFGIEALESALWSVLTPAFAAVFKVSRLVQLSFSCFACNRSESLLQRTPMGRYR